MDETKRVRRTWFGGTEVVVETTSIFTTPRVDCDRKCDNRNYLEAMYYDDQFFRDTGSWEKMEHAAMQVIAQYAPAKRLADIAESRATGSVARGVPKHVFDLRDDAPPVALDAAQVLVFGWLAQAIVKAGKKPENAMQYALAVGRAFERMQARHAEPVAATGEKIKASAKKGHATTHGTDAEKKARRLEYCREVDARRLRGLKLERIYAQVAEKFGVSEKTIRRALNWRKSLDTARHCPD